MSSRTVGLLFNMLPLVKGVQEVICKPQRYGEGRKGGERKEGKKGEREEGRKERKGRE